MVIILSGFKGTGKSTIAKAFASQYHYDYYDVDDVILDNSPYTSISALYKARGEKEFRQLEQVAVAKLCCIDSEQKAIIALGGGTIINQTNFSQLSKLGKIIYLNTDKEVLIDRIQSLAVLPELFRQQGIMTAKDPKFTAVFEKYYQSRCNKYQQTANHIIEMENKDIKTILEEVKIYVESVGSV